MVRTVSLLPAATEIVGALGLLDQLLAVSHECDFPPGVEQLPRATHCAIHGRGLPSAEIDRWVTERLRSGDSLYTIDERLLRALAPDLILTQRLCDVCAPAYGSVAALAAILPSRPRVLNLEPNCLGDVFRNIEDVAEAMLFPRRGVEVVGRLEGRARAVGERSAGLDRPSVFVMEWADPIFNAGHWTPELVRLAGGTPVLAVQGKDSVRVAWPDLRTANPDILIIACCGHTVERTRQDLPALEALPGWWQLRAVRERRTFLANGSAYFSRPGPRLIDTLEAIARMLHPSLFPAGEQERDAIQIY